MAILAVSLLIYSGCKKPPPYTTAPVLALMGPNPYYLSLDSTYIEYGAVAHDDKDGNITNSISWTGGNNITTVTKDTFYVTYKVTNATGYSTTVTRTVYVINNADIIAGKFRDSTICAINGISKDSVLITVLSTNDQITITNFGGFGNNVIVSGTFQHLKDTIYFPPNQSLGGGKYLVSAYGVVVLSDSSFFDTTAVQRNINMQYVWSIGGNQDSCNAVYSK